MTEELIDKLLAIRRARSPEITPGKAALLIIDMQEYQVRKDWPCYKSVDRLVPGLLDYFVKRVVEVVEPNIKRLVELFKRRKMKIIYTMYSSFNRDGSDLPRNIKTINHAVEKMFGDVVFPHYEHPGSKIIDSLKPDKDDLIIIKNTSGVFASTNLDFFLKNMGIEQLIVVGVVTNMCVENAAKVGADLGYDVTVAADACAAWSPEVHKHSLRSFEMIFGSVLNTDQVIEKIREKD